MALNTVNLEPKNKGFLVLEQFLRSIQPDVILIKHKNKITFQVFLPAACGQLWEVQQYCPVI